jgi:glycosyltransferase involved in cell wall biosynthesis
LRDLLQARKAAQTAKPTDCFSIAIMKLEEASIVYLTAGAAGMYCGSCMRDNALAGELIRRGLDVTLLPLYTPIRTDEKNVSVEKVFFGGINVYLQQKIPLFRHLPRFVDRWLDHPWIIRRLASRSVNVDAKELGELTLSMVRGESGFQRKEVGKLVDWLKHEAQPDLLVLTNLLIGGCVDAIRREIGVPVLVTLQGDDLFLDELSDPHRDLVIDEMRQIARKVDGFIVFSDFYAEKMSDFLQVPIEKFHKTALGIDLSDFERMASPKDREGERSDAAGGGRVIGFFARLSPEKGFDTLVTAFLDISVRKGFEDVRLKVGGWLAEKDREFFEAQMKRINAAGLADRFEHVGSPERDEKLAFFESVDVFSIPSPYAEPKGMSVLEAMACGLPVVQPEHGAYLEVLRESGGGLGFPPGDADALAGQLAALLESAGRRRELGERGRRWVHENCGLDAMAESSAALFAKFLAES